MEPPNRLLRIGTSPSYGNIEGERDAVAAVAEIDNERIRTIWFRDRCIIELAQSCRMGREEADGCW